MICEALVLLFIELHGPAGETVHINAAEVSSLRAPIAKLGDWIEGVKCVVVMTNGRVFAVAEDCATVAKKLGEEK